MNNKADYGIQYMIIFVILSFLISIAYDLAYAKEISQSPEPNSFVTLIASVSGIIGAIIGGFVTVYLSPRAKENFELREKYFVPYRQWCSDFFGEMKEFKVRYIELQQQKRTLFDISAIQIVLDYWSLHNIMVDAYKWIGKMWKDDEDLAKDLVHLIETVEHFWHWLENKYPKDLPSVNTPKEFNKALKDMPPDKLQTLAQEIRQHLSQNDNVYNGFAFEKILHYLMKNIPDDFFSTIRRRIRDIKKGEGGK